MHMPFSLASKTALVTGAGRGIGRAIATTLAEYGASVMVNDLDAGPAYETETLIRIAGGTAASFPGDITDPAFPLRMVDAAIERFGSLDIIVNNAGYTWDNVIQKMTDEQFQTMLNVHLMAPFRILRAASAWLRDAAKREAAEGRRVMRKVVNITSVAGIDGGPGQAAYSSAKAGVIGLTKTLAKEWGRYNINVNAVGFGIVETRLVKAITPDGAAAIEVHGRKIPVGAQQKTLDWAKAACPLGRLGAPEEAANAVLFFCSPLSDYVTGEVLICGGGLHF
jgi:3-oxoacyl-[acyl-carrier protein] reductase